MPVFANDQMDMICYFFSFLTRFLFVKLICLVLVISCFLSSSEIHLGVAIYTCLLSLKLNHRLQILIMV